MEWDNILAAVVWIVLLALVLRAAHLLGGNPQRQVKMHEDMGVKLPDNLTLEEKSFRLNLFGFWSSSPGRGYAYIVVAILLFIVAIVGLVKNAP